MTPSLNKFGKHVAMMLQQHDHPRTDLFRIDLPWPNDGRVAVDAAPMCNELYPHLPGRTVHRIASVMSPETAHYLITGEHPPFRSADDITDTVREMVYEMTFLPPSDTFYTFKVFLREKPALLGDRDRQAPITIRCR